MDWGERLASRSALPGAAQQLPSGWRCRERGAACAGLRPWLEGAPEALATSFDSQFLRQWPHIIVCRGSLWYASPKSSPWFLCFSIKASGVSRSGSGPCECDVASSLTLSFSVFANEHKSSSKNARVWEKQPSPAPACLHNPQWFGPNLCLHWEMCRQAGVQKWSCAYRFQN